MRFLLSLLFISSAFHPVTTRAQGNLLITPARVIFDGPKRIQELNLANTGKDTARYLVSLIEIRMNRDGTFEQISTPDPGQHFASSNIRFFPRSVVLPPGEAQVIKLQLVKAGQLAPGEYRSHLYFRAEPGNTLQEGNIATDTAGISVRLTPIFGISIPVIIRIGETVADVSLSALSLDNGSGEGSPKLTMLFNRTGNASVYGNVIVHHISPQGKVTTVATVNGMAVYTPNTSRQFQVNLDNKIGVDYHTGKLQVTYAEARKENQKQENGPQMAQAVLHLR